MPVIDVNSGPCRPVAAAQFSDSGEEVSATISRSPLLYLLKIRSHGAARKFERSRRIEALPKSACCIHSWGVLSSSLLLQLRWSRSTIWRWCDVARQICFCWSFGDKFAGRWQLKLSLFQGMWCRSRVSRSRFDTKLHGSQWEIFTAHSGFKCSSFTRSYIAF